MLSCRTEPVHTHKKEIPAILWPKARSKRKHYYMLRKMTRENEIWLLYLVLRQKLWRQIKHVAGLKQWKLSMISNCVVFGARAPLNSSFKSCRKWTRWLPVLLLNLYFFPCVVKEIKSQIQFVTNWLKINQLYWWVLTANCNACFHSPTAGRKLKKSMAAWKQWQRLHVKNLLHPCWNLSIWKVKEDRVNLLLYTIKEELHMHLIKLIALAYHDTYLKQIINGLLKWSTW